MAILRRPNLWFYHFLSQPFIALKVLAKSDYRIRTFSRIFDFITLRGGSATPKKSEREKLLCQDRFWQQQPTMAVAAIFVREQGSQMTKQTFEKTLFAGCEDLV
jgi:hypothetical protein